MAAASLLSIVLELPPAPADLVLVGLALATLSCRSAAARLLIMVLGPPGGLGEVGRTPVLEPGDVGELGGGEDCNDALVREELLDGFVSLVKSCILFFTSGNTLIGRGLSYHFDSWPTNAANK